jgi:transglutaminase-like putative cysteine protease
MPLAVWSWAKHAFRYQQEYPHVVANLPQMLRFPVGDCNDFAVVTAALAIAGRVPVRWALGYDARGVPRHVWSQYFFDGQWVDVDPTPGAPPPGDGSPVDVPGVKLVGYDVIPVEA